MRGTRRWVAVALGGLGLWLGCGRDEPKPAGPSAERREGRSQVLRGLMGSREKVDPEALQSASPAAGGLASGGGVGPNALAPEGTDPNALGQGGSGRPEPTGLTGGRVSWVGDDELLFRDATGEEREVQVDDGSRLLLNGKEARLHDLSEGMDIRVSYDETTGGWVAREVEVVPRRAPPPRDAEPGEAPGTPAAPEQ